MWNCSSQVNLVTCELQKLLYFASQRLIFNFVSKEDLSTVFNFNDYDPDELVKTLKKSNCDKKFNRYFDSMSHIEKVYSIYFFLNNIVDLESSAPKLMAWNESAISAIFTQLFYEICVNKNLKAKQILIEALKSIKTVNSIDYAQLSENSTNAVWSNAIDCLKYNILYDNDYDLTPDTNEYFSSIQVDLGKRKVAEMLIEIMGFSKQYDVYE